LEIGHGGAPYDIEVIAYTGTGAGKAAANLPNGGNVVAAGFPTEGPQSTWQVTYTKTLIDIPATDSASAAITFVRVRLINKLDDTTLHLRGAGLTLSGVTRDYRLHDEREPMAVTSSPAFNGNYHQQVVRNSAWNGTGTIEWRWNGTAWTAIS